MSPLKATFLLSLLIGLSCSLSTESSSSNNTDTPLNCTFFDKTLKCEYQTEIVECDAISSIFNLTVLPIQVFGLGAINESDVELVRIALFPRLLDLHVYLPSSIVVNGETVNMSLYYSLTDSDVGIRVTDEACFSRLLSLIGNVQELHRVTVQQNLVGDGQDVELVGLLSINNPNSRIVRQWGGRWGGGWGRGRFGGGWGRGRYW